MSASGTPSFSRTGTFRGRSGSTTSLGGSATTPRGGGDSRRYSTRDLAALQELYDLVPTAASPRNNAQQQVLSSATPVSEQGSDCTITSSVYKPTRPSTARTVSSAVSQLRAQGNGRCLSAQTSRLNTQLRVNSAAAERRDERRRPRTAEAHSGGAKSNSRNQNIFLTATARYRLSQSQGVASSSSGGKSQRGNSSSTTAAAVPHPPSQPAAGGGGLRRGGRPNDSKSTEKGGVADAKSVAGGAFVKPITQCENALEGLRHLQLQMSDPVAAAALQEKIKREIRREDRAAAAGANGNGDGVAVADSTAVFSNSDDDSDATSTATALDHDEQALEELKQDGDLGYQRHYVSGNLIMKRVEAKLEHYRRHPDEMEHLEARVERRKAQHRHKLKQQFLDTLQKQRERRVGRVSKSYLKKATGGSVDYGGVTGGVTSSSPSPTARQSRMFSSVPGGGGRPASTGRGSGAPLTATFAPLSDDDDDDGGGVRNVDTGVNAAAGGITSALPYFKQVQQQQEKYGTVGFRQVRSYDQLVNHNNSRWQEGRRAYVQALQKKRERTEKVISRHDEIVARADEERRKEAMAAVIADWLVIARLQQSAMALHRIMTMLGVTRQGLDVYRTMRGYYLKWFVPTRRRMDALRRRQLRGKVLFGLCAARMFAHIEVRRKAVGTVVLFGTHLQSAGSFKVALARFRHYLVICQRVVRQFLFHRRRRLQLLMMQWNRIEEPVRKVAENQQRQDAARRRREQDQRRAFMSSKAIKAEREKQLRMRKTMSRDQLVAVKVKEILDVDPFNFAQPIPFRLKLEVLGAFWTERRQKFHKYEMPAQYVADKQTFRRKSEAFELAGLAGQQKNLRKPRAPKKKQLPLFFPSHTMEKLVKSTLQSMQEIAMDMKQHAATQIVTMPDLDLRYNVLRDNLFMQRFGVSEGHQRLVDADWREK